MYYKRITAILKDAVAEGKTLDQAMADIKAIPFAKPYDIYISFEGRMVFGIANRAQALIHYMATQLLQSHGDKMVKNLLDVELSFNRISDNNEIDYFEFAQVGLGTNILFGEAIDNTFAFSDMDSIVCIEGQWVRHCDPLSVTHFYSTYKP